MLCWVNMNSEINVTKVLTVQVEQVAGRKKTESDYMEEEN